MFEIGWTEMLVIAVVMIVVVGPKDLPKMLRTFGKFTSKMTSMAGDFRRQFDDALKEAELDDVRNSVNDLRSLNPKTEIRKAFNPMEKAAADIRAGMDSVMRPSTPAPSTPAPTEPTAAEPLKTGATAEPASVSAEPVKAEPVKAEPMKEASGLSVGIAEPVQPVAATVPVTPSPVAPPAAVAVATAAAAEPVKKPRAPRAPKAPALADAPAPKASPKKAAAASTDMNGTAVVKPVRARKPKETGTAS